MFLDAWYDRERRSVRVSVVSGDELEVRDHAVPVDVVALTPDGDRLTFDGRRARAWTLRSMRTARDIERRYPAGAVDFPRTDPALRVLEREYAGSPRPDPVRAFLDIEVDVDPERGFAGPDDPFAPVVAFSVHMRGRSTVVAVAPEGRDPGANGPLLLVRDERTLLRALTESVLPGVHLWAGWNSSGFDLPYLVRRLERLGMHRAVAAFCAGTERPVPRQVDRFGSRVEIFETRGRVHLDYMDLYRRFVRRELHSYALDHVAHAETGRRKVPYRGTLGRLVREDFDRFVEYSITDVELLAAIEEKRRLLDLAVTMAWSSLVPVRLVTGTVRVIEQAVTTEARRRGYVVPPPGWYRDLGDRERTDDLPVAGAAVLDPKVGVHRWVSSIDVSSLYPSVIRTLNVSPETLVGQLDLSRTRELVRSRLDAGEGSADAWADLFGTVEYRMVVERSEEEVTLHCVELSPWLPGGAWTAPAREIAEVVLDPRSPLALAGSGAVFRTDVEGIVPGLLARWYERRARERRAARVWARLAADGYPLEAGGEDGA